MSLCRKSGVSKLFKETAQHIVNHESPRTTMLYDRRQENVALDEVELNNASPGLPAVDDAETVLGGSPPERVRP